MMLMPSRASVSNMVAATPECERMPTPTIDTFAMSSVSCTSLAPISRTSVETSVIALAESTRGTVNEMSVSPSWLMFWMIMSTTMFSLAMPPKSRAAMPGRSGTPSRVILAWLRS